ncbi:hypothetical protein BH20ACI3_BH20ACI3_38040 [soil metagenome]
MPLAPNTRFGRYEIRSQLGAGGMGEVYLAQDTKLDRKVALKVLLAEIAHDEDRVRRFVQEAKAASALNHPNILTVYEVGDFEDSRFIVTEFIKGITLRERLVNEPLALRETLDVAVQVAAALNAAHEAGIVHRDIKPENIMLRDDGLVKVLDFGLAKLSEAVLPQAGGLSKEKREVEPEEATRLLVKTKPGVVMGTVAYMSPEQARGKATNARTDVWSLGVVLYEMLAGKQPFAGETTTDVLAIILHREPAPLDANVPLELQRIIKKALQKNADERYQTIKDLLLDLKHLKRELEFSDELERSHIPAFAKSANVGAVNQSSENATVMQPAVSTQNSISQQPSSAEYVFGEVRRHKFVWLGALAILLLGAIGLGYWFFASGSASATQITSIAVLPFINESGNADLEYLSDGMTESLIGSLSQIPNLNVKARSSVFRYKGNEVDPQKVAAELSVQAILSGRVVQRGDDLTLYLSLVDGRNGNQIWGEQYDRKLSQLVSLQSEIARDVSQKLRARLAGADVQKVTRNYTENAEAYQLYLKGRYHLLKVTRSEIQTGISYFQQAIAVDPSYALAYVGLAGAYRALAIGGEMPATEFLPKARAAAQKAIEIDNALAEAHAELGFIIFWYDWDWSAVENQCKRALELDPNSADAHLAYAHLLSNTGRHAEGLAEAKRARELDPLNLRTNALEGEFLIHAGRTDEALARLQKTFELDPNYWFAHLFASSAYIEKGMFAEAVAEARKARELNPINSQPIAFEGYALAKSGKRAEARAVLEELLKLSNERYVPPYNIALIYNGLGERDEAIAWLERGFEQRDPRMVFLKVEPKWNNLHDDPRFQDLQRRVGFQQ